MCSSVNGLMKLHLASSHSQSSNLTLSNEVRHCISLYILVFVIALNIRWKLITMRLGPTAIESDVRICFLCNLQDDLVEWCFTIAFLARVVTYIAVLGRFPRNKLIFLIYIYQLNEDIKFLEF